MKCPTCGKQTEGRNHNKRGLRCTCCWALLPDEVLEKRTFDSETPAVEASKPKRRRKPASK